MANDREEFGQKLRSAIESKGHSFASIARHFGYHRSVVTRWLTGDRRISPKDLGRLCDYLRLENTEKDALFEKAGYAYIEEAPPDDVSPPPPVVRFLNQLRPPVADFVGRRSEISRVVEFLRRAEQGDAAITAGITGMPGVGKTELAFYIARQVRNNFPGAQLLIELGGAMKPHAPAQGLQAVIHAFEPNLRLSENLDELQPIYRSILNQKRVLIIADDAGNVAQLRPLLPPAGSALLATSRQRIIVAGMVVQDLPVLPLTEAEELLLEICPRIAKQSSHLAELCGRLPLALRISASLLFVHDTRDVEQFLATLEVERIKLLKNPDEPNDPQASVEASIGVSYDALKTSEKAALRKLSLFPASFTREAALSVTASPKQEDTNSLLEQLRQHSLLEWDAVSQRFSLHDLVRVFALERLRPKPEENLRVEYLEACRKFILYYREYMNEMNSQIYVQRHPPHQVQEVPRWGNVGRGEWLDQLNKEYANVHATLELSIAGDIEIALAAEVCARLAKYWDLSGSVSEGRRWLSRMLNFDLSPILRARVLQAAGQLASDQSDYKAANEMLKESLELYRTHGGKRDCAIILQLFGTLKRHQKNEHNEYLEAKALLEESRQLYDELSDRLGIAVVVNGMGCIARNVGDYESAIGLLQQSLDYYQDLKFAGKLPDDEGIAWTLHDLAETYQTRGNTADIDAARACYQDSIRLFRELPDNLGVGWSLHNQGYLAAEQGLVKQSLAYFSEALRLFQKSDLVDGIAACLIGLAQVRAEGEQGGVSDAAQLLGASDAIFEEKEAPWVLPLVGKGYDRALTAARGRLSEEEFGKAWNKGKGLSIEQIIADALDKDWPGAS